MTSRYEIIAKILSAFQELEVQYNDEAGDPNFSILEVLPSGRLLFYGTQKVFNEGFQQVDSPEIGPVETIVSFG